MQTMRSSPLAAARPQRLTLAPRAFFGKKTAKGGSKKAASKKEEPAAAPKRKER